MKALLLLAALAALPTIARADFTLPAEELTKIEADCGVHHCMFYQPLEAGNGIVYFGLRFESDSETDATEIVKYDTNTKTTLFKSVLAHWPWDSGAYHAVVKLELSGQYVNVTVKHVREDEDDQFVSYRLNAETGARE